MKIVKRFAKGCCIVVPVLALVWGCPFDNTLREYLSARFWQPFAKTGTSFEKRGVRRMSAPFAGMRKTAGETPLEDAYRPDAEKILVMARELARYCRPWASSTGAWRR